jgi:hypothetical protein
MLAHVKCQIEIEIQWNKEIDQIQILLWFKIVTNKISDKVP